MCRATYHEWICGCKDMTVRRCGWYLAGDRDCPIKKTDALYQVCCGPLYLGCTNCPKCSWQMPAISKVVFASIVAFDDITGFLSTFVCPEKQIPTADGGTHEALPFRPPESGKK
jgi:hypothetical protein